MSDIKKNFLDSAELLQGNSAKYLEQMHAKYSNNENDLDLKWQEFFMNFSDSANLKDTNNQNPSWSRKDWPPIDGEKYGFGEELQPQFESKIKSKLTQEGLDINAGELRRAVLDSVRALMLIRAYRIRGHLAAELDPLKVTENNDLPELDPRTYGFQLEDMDRQIYIDNVLGLELASMKEIIDIVHRTYCGTFALQYMHISNPDESQWLKERIEGYGKEINFTKRGRKAILNKLVEAEGFEKFLHVKYMGTKRFGLDGGEALIPAMEQIIKRGGALGVKDIIIGMPHRGRLNVLVNVLAKPLRAIFNEFQGGSFKPKEVDGSGDVKYHLGASSDREFDGNKVHLSLTANPSHLEAVNPVVLGKARAKQEQYNDDTRRSVMPILLHGDAAFAGQGVVAECFGLSGLTGHRTGGTMHIVINNQIGFTTAPHFSRSSPYPTDIALMVEAPIFHVNGDDPEAVVHAAKVATEFRQKFAKDVVLDIFCYRRFGHNEGDEPMFTQPLMYKTIKNHKTTLEIYSERLIKDGLVPQTEIEVLKKNFQKILNDEFEAGKNFQPNKADWLDGRWSHLNQNNENYQRGTTAISLARYKKISKALTNVPKDFELHKTVKRQLASKKEVLKEGVALDWATGEALAFGSLLLEGFPVRLAGQDSARGTFSQRHSVLIDQNTEDRFFPLNQIDKNQKYYEVIDSMLSEYAILGFEYGYSLSEPNALVIWEAQFGDFANGAQIMFDQFISSGERKWLRMSGLVMLLPHGFEGQGPEHSSARLERFLQNSAEENWIIANCTTPANYFHILRRQLHRTYRKPLVLMTPKSLLRNKFAVSQQEDFIEGSSFHRVLWDDAQKENSSLNLEQDINIKRVIVCSGKIYYDLLKERDSNKLSNIYLLRVEQLYPVPGKALTKELNRFKNAQLIWCQEEPKNQGAWSFIEPNLEIILSELKIKAKRAKFVGRPPSASPATGLASQHKEQQEKIIFEALDLEGG
ncbi:MAG: 2-oxoglutarate dehydrogenase E1 component [Paracoccaceae bacterium]|nr:2-oxoglutarate dehydrogenase E1 component [Paracoccaceae bacterium]